jgi:formylglycine-generating enzyme required for sulfatase activity
VPKSWLILRLQPLGLPLFADDFSSYTPGSDIDGQGGWVGRQVVGLGFLDGQQVPRNSQGNPITDFNCVTHTFARPAEPTILTMNFSALAYSTTTAGHWRSHDSGIGLTDADHHLPKTSGFLAGWNPDTNEGPAVWNFDARGLLQAAGRPEAQGVIAIPGGFDKPVQLGVVIDRQRGEVFGTYDFGNGPQQTPHLAIPAVQLAGIDRVEVTADHRWPDGGTSFRGVLVSNLSVTTPARPGSGNAGPPPAPVASPKPPVTEPPQGPNGLRAELFADMELRHCVKVRYDPEINFDWGLGSPDPLLPADAFSVRWTGWLKAPKPGKYTLRLEADDGARLWLDGRLLIDRWQPYDAGAYQVEVDLTDGPHELRVEYVEVFGGATVRLSWARQDGFGMLPVPAWALFHDRAAAAKAVTPPVALIPEKRVTAAEVLRARQALAERLGLKEEEEIDLGGVKLKLMLVPKGSFWMGDGAGKPGDRQVQIAQDFYLGAYPVTQGQWQAIMGSNPSWFSRTGNGKDKVKDISDADLKQFPVEQVSWDDAQEFIRKLNQRQKAVRGWVYRLPTEEEWEYACRGGASSREDCSFDFYLDRPTNDLSSTQANFNGNFPAGSAAKGPWLERTAKVGSYQPNRLGIYDLHGNVWQWTASVADSVRVVRGGCWADDGSSCRAAFRSGDPPSRRRHYLGFRLALSPSGGKDK